MRHLDRADLLHPLLPGLLLLDQLALARGRREKKSGLFLVERRILAGSPTEARGFPRLILLLFGGIPNSPAIVRNLDASPARSGSKVTKVVRPRG